LLIQCKGTKKNSIIEKCLFLYDGNWNDEELINHQKLHKSSNDKNSIWLGFDVSQPFGKLSGRDGKRN